MEFGNILWFHFGCYFGNYIPRYPPKISGATLGERQSDSHSYFLPYAELLFNDLNIIHINIYFVVTSRPSAIIGQMKIDC